ncbi:MAG: endo-1,3-alpha-glucanase family glycosylhydrolase [Chloroflexota bacterium]
MKSKKMVWALICLAVAGCQVIGLGTPGAPPEASPLAKQTQAPTSVPPARHTEPAPTQTAQDTRLPIPPTEPVSTPVPEEIRFYHLRIEYSTSSDWSTLEVLNAETILSARLAALEGSPSAYEAQPRHLSLNQTLESAEVGHVVGMSVDYAFAAQAGEQGVDFLLQKGALYGSTVRIYALAAGEKKLIKQVSHQKVVKADPGLNPLRFSLDAQAFEAVALETAQLERPGIAKMVWAFYYPWYHTNEWSSPILKDRPAVPYASDDQRAIARQIQQAQTAGIDGFISSWWGPGDYTDQNLAALLELAETSGFRVMIYFETLTDNGPRDSDEIQRWLEYFIPRYGEHPALMRIEGKPVIVVWASGTVPLETWQEVFTNLRSKGLEAEYLAMGYNLANLEVFDGLHEYGIFTLPGLAGTYQSVGRAVRYYGLLDEPPRPRLWVATVQPGYDDRLIPGRDGLVQEREQGGYYRSTFAAALQSDPDWIFITTWNEWWEHTYIEPSELYGDLYLQITQEYAARWKSLGR